MAGGWPPQGGGGAPPKDRTQLIAEENARRASAGGQSRVTGLAGEIGTDAEHNAELSAHSVVNPGTTWARPTIGAADGKPLPWMGGRDSDANYMYGRRPGGADEAVNYAWQTGQAAADAGVGAQQTGVAADIAAQQRGQWMYQQGAAVAGRQAQLGDYGVQNQTLGQLGGLEATQGPSAAQAQLQAGTNEALASQLALARSGRGFGGGAAAMGQAQGNAAQIQASQANQAAALRAQEDAAWRQRQAANLGNVAGFQGQQAQSDLSAYYQNQGQSDQTALSLYGLGQGDYQGGTAANLQGAGIAQQGYGTSLAGQQVGNQVRTEELHAGQKLQDDILREWAAREGKTLAGEQAQKDQETSLIAAGAGLAATAATAMSDVRAKKDIVRTDAPAIEFARAGSMVTPQSPDTAALDAAAASPGYGYQYVDPSEPGAKPGQQYGPMAQDLASTPAGRTAVVKQPNGKLGIDPGRLSLLNTSAVAAQQKQIDELQAKLQAFSSQPGASYPLPSQGSF